MLDIHGLLDELRTDRPVFHSEADFQHSLAWLIHRRHPEAAVRLEVPAFAGTRGHVDLLVRLGSTWIPIELKYWQARLSHRTTDGEDFRLINQSAQDMHRAAFVQDIVRVEELVLARAGSIGWVVALTNDPSYWEVGRPGGATSDAAFRIHEGRELAGPLAWRAGTSANTTKGKTDLSLHGRYICQWSDYSKVADHRTGTFKYVALEVR